METAWMLFPGGLAKALTLSYDDGVEQDLRLLEIMNRYGLKGTFNLNSGQFAAENTVYPKGQIHRRLSKSACLELYGKDGHEVAIHAYYHGDLTVLPREQAAWQVMKDKETLEEYYGGIIRGFAYPYGTYNDDVVKLLESCGVAYARTVESTHQFEIPRDWLRMPATCHHNDPLLMELAERFLGDTGTRVPKLFYLWGHSYEFEANDNWEVIEKFASYIGGRDDIWYASNIAIYDYIADWKRLRTSANGKTWYNPSARSLWIKADGKPVEIRSGEALILD